MRFPEFPWSKPVGTITEEDILATASFQATVQAGKVDKEVLRGALKVANNSKFQGLVLAFPLGSDYPYEPEVYDRRLAKATNDLNEFFWNNRDLTNIGAFEGVMNKILRPKD